MHRKFSFAYVGNCTLEAWSVDRSVVKIVTQLRYELYNFKDQRARATWAKGCNSGLYGAQFSTMTLVPNILHALEAYLDNLKPVLNIIMQVVSLRST